MLTPAFPDKSDSLFREKMEQLRRDQAHKKAHPDSWGVVRHGAEPPAGAPAGDDAGNEVAGKKGR